MKFFAVLLLWSSLFGQEITGFWKTIDEVTGQPRAVIAIYPYGGKCYGRIVGTYDPAGRIQDTIYAPRERAPGVWGNPPYCGIDIICGLERKGGKNFKGKIIDPERGNVYNCELWTECGKLIVRGKLLCFGKNQAWVAAQESDFSGTFRKPDVTTFVPAFPKVKSGSK